MQTRHLFSLTCFVLRHCLGVTAFSSALIQRLKRKDSRCIQQQEFRRQLQHATIPKESSSSSFLATSSSPSEPASSDKDSPKIDVDAILKYAAATGTQMTLFYGIFKGVDYLTSLANFKVPLAVNCVLFWFAALKSRVLNPLNNSRPKQDSLETADSSKRNMPSWTPPGFIFPIMWILIIGPIRAATTAIVYAATGAYANTAILSLMLHLSIGDCWNSINNVERRYGASVIGVLMVWLSNAHAAYQYYQVSPMAGKLLCLPLVWLTVASSLIIRTWQLNADPTTGKPYPLYPVQGQGKTKFVWFQQ